MSIIVFIAIQAKAGPRNTTIRRQMPRPVVAEAVPPPMNLTMPKKKQVPPLMPMYNPYRTYDPNSVCDTAAGIVLMNTNHFPLIDLRPGKGLALKKGTVGKLFILGGVPYLYPIN